MGAEASDAEARGAGGAPAEGARRHNPYVGPRSFTTGESLYGRDRELQKLLRLLIAERIVVLYSPSGAGKTSLIQAGLVPRLRGEEFRVLPVVRVNLEPGALDRDGAPGTRASAAGRGGQRNRYVLSALVSLEEELPPERRTPTEALTETDLVTYLARRRAAEAGAPTDRVLLFDQFEEILALDPTDHAAKVAFFAQVGEALRDRHLWALFALREDHLAGLDPYLRPVPTRLRTTFRLDLLDEGAALQAMQRPARRAGVEFTDAAARRLVDDLRRVRVQRPDGATDERLGPYVEPVQLQVVCLRLWEQLAPDANQIGAADLDAVGDVDEALATYYADRVAAVAAQTGLPERAVREWVDRELITDQGIRGQVLQGPEESRGLDNRAIRLLVSAFLVRAEERRGAFWYELAHDRLIEPVRKNNAAWFERNLSPLQRTARLWNGAGRPEGLLLRDASLAEAERGVGDQGHALTSVERAFLEASRRAQRAAERERRMNRRIRALAVGATIASLVALSLFGLTMLFYLQASEQRRLAESQELASSALARIPVDPQESVRLARRAYELAPPDRRSEIAASPLRYALSASHVRATMGGHGKPVEAVAFSPDGRLLATASQDGTGRLWEAATGRPVATLTGHTADVTGVAFSPDGELLVTAARDGTARTWRAPTGEPGHTLAAPAGDGRVVAALSPDGRSVATGDQGGAVQLWEAASGRVLAEHREHTAAVTSVELSPDSRLVLSAGDDGAARVWDTATGEVKVLAGPAPAPTRLIHAAFSPDGRLVVTAGDDGTARVWDAATQGVLAVLSGHALWVTGAAFSPDGRLVATASGDKTARVWEVATGRTVAELRGHGAWVSAAAFSPDGRLVATASQDGTARVWDAATGEAVAELRGHTRFVTGAAFSPDGRSVATSGEDNTARVWRVPTGEAVAAPLGHGAWVSAAAFSPDGRLVATADEDAANTPRLWDAATGAPVSMLPGHGAKVEAVAFSPDGRRIVTAGEGGAARVWDAATGAPVSTLAFTGYTGRLYSAAFSPDGRHILTAGEGGTARVSDAAEGEVVATLPRYGDMVRAAFSPDGRRVVAASHDRTARVWDLAKGEVVATLVGHAQLLNGAAFSPDGRLVVTASQDGTARVWRVETGSVAATLVGHASALWSAAFSPDGRLVATASQDGTARVWDAATGQRLIVLRGHSSWVTSAAFSPDGRRIVTTSGDRTARLWDCDICVPDAELVRLAGQREGR